MKKLFTAIFIFFVSIFILDKIIFYSLDYFYKKTFVGQEGGDIQKYLTDNNPPKMVIMGSSTARFQVNPDSFSITTCNLAHYLTGDCYQLGLLSLLIQKAKTPKYILLSLAPRNYILTEKKDNPPEDILFLKYYYYQSSFIRKEINNISFLERCKYLFSSYRFNGSVFNTLKYFYLSKKSNPNQYYFRYQASFVNDSINTVNAVKMRNNNLTKMPAPLSGIQTSYLPRFIDSCKKNNIQLICYYMPQLKEDTVLVKNGLDFMESLIAQKGIPYFKFTEQNAGGIYSNLSYWSDGEHLNDKGGAIQSQILATFVKQFIK